MTDQALRDLLHERVREETTVDLAPRAWRAGRAARRRRGLAVAAGVVAGAAAVTGAVGWVDTGRPAPLATDGVAPALVPAGGLGTPDATYAGVAVWWSPGGVEERTLPWVEDGPLPRVVDLSVRSTALGGPVRAAFAQGDTVLLVDGDGGVVAVDVSRLDRVAKPNGYRLPAPSERMLSPDGARLLFPQDGSVEVYTVATGEWRSIETDLSTVAARWGDADTVVVPTGPGGAVAAFPLGDGGAPGPTPGPPLSVLPDTGSAQPYGATVAAGPSSAQAWGAGGLAIPVRDPATDATDPEHLAFETPAGSGVLALTWAAGGTDGRFKQCCPVAGWLDERTLVYESRQVDAVLVAWAVGTGDFRRVASVEGTYDVASYADLS